MSEQMRIVTVIAVGLALLLVRGASANTAPEVTNVIATQRVGTHLVDISYDAFDADGDSLTVEVFLSVDGGVSYPFQCTSLTGDAGAGVVPATGLAIVWDAGVDYPGFTGSSCSIRVTAEDNFVAEPPAVDIVILMDRSGSMSVRWSLISDQLNAFYSDAESDGINVALIFFPPPGSVDPCDVTNYDPPYVPLGQLPSHGVALASAFTTVGTGGLAPTYAGLYAALAFATNHKGSNPSRIVATILVTDSSPNQCNTSIVDIADLAGNAFNGWGVPTYAVGLPGSSAAELDQIAAAGGTTQSRFADDSATLELLQAMREIRDALLTTLPKR